VTKISIYKRIDQDFYSDGTECLTPWVKLEKQFIAKLEGEFTNDKRELRKGEMIWVNEIENALGVFCPYISRIMAIGYGTNSLAQKARLEKMLSIISKDSLRTPNQDTVDKFKSYETSREAITVFNNLSHTIGNTIRGMSSLHNVCKYLEENSSDNIISALFTLWTISLMDNVIGKFVRELLNRYALRNPDFRELVTDPIVNKGKRQNKSKKEKYKIFKQLANSLTKEDIETIIQTIKGELNKLVPNIEKYINELNVRLFPCGKSDESHAYRKMGGLSLERINALKYFVYSVMRPFEIFKHRFQNGKSDSENQEALDLKPIGKKQITKISNIVEARQKRIASLLIRIALDPNGYTNNPKCTDIKRAANPSERCRVIITENLTNFKPDLSRTRRENRYISDLHTATFRNELAGLARRYGLLFLQVDPAETSVIDSITGSIGLRGREVTGKQCMNDEFIKAQFKDAQEHIENGDNSEEYLYLKKLHDELSKLSKESLRKKKNIYIPQKGGNLFFRPDNGKIWHSDLNASFNILQRGCSAPDFVSNYKKWFDKDAVPVNGKNNNSQASTEGKSPSKNTKKGDKSKPQKTKQYVLMWRFRSLDPTDQNCVWLPTTEFFAKVRSMVAKSLLKRRYPSYSGPGFDP
jgi:hypothetical protein